MIQLTIRPALLLFGDLTSRGTLRARGADVQQSFTQPADLLITRLGRLEPLSERERNVLRLIEKRIRHSYRPDTRLLSERTEIRMPQFILSGWACRLRELADGRRQIISVLLPGDAIGLCARTRPLSMTSTMSLTQLRTVEAPEMAVAWRERGQTPGLSAALDLAAAEEEYFMLGQVMRLGRQTAYERIANWFMEIDYRLTTRGLAADGAIPMPLTQETLADVVGLSVVHVNRTLQQMRREGRIEMSRSRLAILDKTALNEAGEFTPPALAAPVVPANDAHRPHLAPTAGPADDHSPSAG